METERYLLDVIGVYLLYFYERTGSTMFEYTQALEYKNIANDILHGMDSKYVIAVREEDINPLYNLVTDRAGALYVTLREGVNLNERWHHYFDSLPSDIVISLIKALAELEHNLSETLKI